MAAFLRQIKIRVLTLTSRKSNEKIKIYGAADIEGYQQNKITTPMNFCKICNI